MPVYNTKCNNTNSKNIQPDLLASSSESDGCIPTSLSILSEVEVDVQEYNKIATVRAPDITEVTRGCCLYTIHQPQHMVFCP